MKEKLLGLLVLVALVLGSCEDDEILRPKLPQISLKTPTNNSNGVDILPTFTWEASDPDGKPLTYDFYIGPDSSSQLLQASDLTSPEYKLTEYSLKKENKYYWHVYAKNGSENVKSELWSFNSIPAPVAPVLSGPDEGIFVREEATFTWEAAPSGEGETLYYEIYLGENETDLEKIGTVEGETSFVYDVSELEIGKVYYWAVATSDLINSSMGAARSFKKLMVGAPDEPYIVSPVENTATYETSVDLSWTAVADPEGDAVSYDIYMDENPDPTTLIATVSEVTYTVSPADANKAYYWKIVAKDPSNNYTESTISTVSRLAVGAPKEPVLEDLEIEGILSLDEAIKWNAVVEPDGQAVTYDVYVGDAYPPVNKVASDISETQYQILNKDLPCDITNIKTFYCTVVAKDPDGNESTSFAKEFKPQMTGTFIDNRVTDIQEYRWIRIGTQIWMADNLRTKVLNDGTTIDYVGSNKPAKDRFDQYWWDVRTGYSDYFDGDWEQENGLVYTYGLAVHPSMPASGWRVPTKTDCNLLGTYTGKDVVGLACEWSGGTDIYGFNFRGGGRRYPEGNWKSGSDDYDVPFVWAYSLKDAGLKFNFKVSTKKWEVTKYNSSMMFSIRLLRDE